MILYPALDLQQGRVVSPRQGDPIAPTTEAQDAITIAQRYVSEGAEWLHLNNLDFASNTTKVIQIGAASSAADSLSPTLQIIKEICQQLSVPVQYRGCLQSQESLRLAFELGVARVILGASAVEKPLFIGDAIKKWGAERIVIRLAVRKGAVVIPGGQAGHEVDMVEMGHRLYALGVRKVLFTTPSHEDKRFDVVAASRLGDSTGLYVIADNVVEIDSLSLLKEYEYYNIEGAIINPHQLSAQGAALPSALTLAHAPLSRHSAGVIPYQWSNGALKILIIYNYALEQWQLLRGHIEANESAEECARREFTEQTALELEHFHTDPVITLHFTRKFREYQIDRSICFFLGRAAEGEVRLRNENHCEALWASPQEALALLTEAGSEQIPALETALRQLEIG